MFSLVAAISLDDVVDNYLRQQTELIGQAEMGRRIGTKRQGVNAIINGKRRFTLEHLSRFADRTGIPASRLLRDLAVMAWEREGELLPRPALPPMPQPYAPEPPPPAVGENAADLLRAILQELRKRP